MCIRDSNIPDLIKEGTVQYGMQSFDQSLMSWYSRGTISYENALFHATNPNELALRVQGVAGSGGHPSAGPLNTLVRPGPRSRGRLGGRWLHKKKIGLSTTQERQ